MREEKPDQSVELGDSQGLSSQRDRRIKEWTCKGCRVTGIPTTEAATSTTLDVSAMKGEI
jgi:hypothetical protein